MRSRWAYSGLLLPKHIRCVQPGFERVEPLDDCRFAVLCQFKNGALYLDTFIQHYLRLGASRIVLLDNGSTDESLEVLSRYPEVRVLSADVSYYRYLVAVRHYLKKTYAKNAWSLTVDIDELFDFPGSSQITMHEFLKYLNVNGYNAVHGYMLDRFAEHAVGLSGSKIGDDLSAKYPYYDLRNIEKIPYQEEEFGPRGSLGNVAIQNYFGGVREQAIGLKANLSKFPLVRDGCGQVAGVHRVYNASVADVSVVLNHFRFLDDLLEVSRNFAKQEGKNRYGSFLKDHLAGIETRPYSEGAVSWRGVDALVDQEFLMISPAYKCFLDEREVTA